jgi:2-oxoglutarate ferredoxin oxidoreductase subunit alpha
MVKIRAEKIAKIADSIPLQKVNHGAEKGEVLMLSWGSTFGVVKTAVKQCNAKGMAVGHIHLTYLSPFPKNLGDLLKNYDHIIVPEINNGQLVKIIRDQFLVDAKGLNKIKGIPFSTKEIVEAIEQKFELA